MLMKSCDFAAGEFKILLRGNIFEKARMPLGPYFLAEHCENIL